jgi:hypothetical protein
MKRPYALQYDVDLPFEHQSTLHYELLAVVRKRREKLYGSKGVRLPDGVSCVALWLIEQLIVLCFFFTSLLHLLPASQSYWIASVFTHQDRANIGTPSATNEASIPSHFGAFPSYTTQRNLLSHFCHVWWYARPLCALCFLLLSPVISANQLR